MASEEKQEAPAASRAGSDHCAEGEVDALSILKALAGIVNAPADWAAEHDHYLYGTVKRRDHGEGAATSGDAPSLLRPGTEADGQAFRGSVAARPVIPVAIANTLSSAERHPMFDPRLADANYRSFPTFAEWARCRVDPVRWDRYTAVLAERGKASPEQLAEAREVVKRAAAVDTGAIEGLYEVDRGFTFTVATQAAIWEAALDAKGPHVRALIESQLKAYDYVLDVATQYAPISEAWIRTLHQELCGAQESYSVMTEVGPQTQRLPVGEYKHLPNHVRIADGSIHSYAPVDLVPAEMHRLVEALRGEEFLAAHPVLQASYAHYAFVVIHPFADGNGRVARALASVYTYRSHSIPLLILVDNRKEYLDSLAAADGGDYQAFVDFVLERSLDAILLVNESLGAAMSPQPGAVLDELNALFTTKGGYTQEQVDEAGQRLYDIFLEELATKAEEMGQEPRLQIRVHRSRQSPKMMIPNSRNLILSDGAVLAVTFESGSPLEAYVRREFAIVVPLDAGREDDVSLIEISSQRRVFSARISELVPAATAGLRMRIAIATQRLLGEGLTALVSESKRKMTNNSE